MFDSKPSRTSCRRSRGTVLAAFAAVSAALLGVLGFLSSAVRSSSATSPIAAEPLAYVPRVGLPGDQRGALEADGAVPEGTTVFDDEIPGVANLDPALLGPLRRAAADAADDGVEFFVESGWRSREYQQQLLNEAVSEYGSEGEAARWVARPSTSAHVSGDAVDIAHSDASAWLSEHGAKYGLCPVYRNEPWHYELRPGAVHRECPAMYADPTHDPRMQQ